MQDSIAAARQSGPTPQDDGTSAFEYNFSASDPVFAGHFPHRPILPGIFQLEIVRLAAELTRNQKFTVREIAKAKFQRPIIPGEILKLNLSLTEADGGFSARATFACGGQPAGEAWLLLA